MPYEAERLLEKTLEMLRVNLPVAVAEVAAEHDAIDAAERRVRIPLPAPAHYVLGPDPVVVDTNFEDYPIVLVAGGGRVRDRRLGFTNYGQATPVPYDVRVESWMATTTREATVRSVFRYAKAVIRVLQGPGKEVYVEGFGFVKLVPQDGWEPDVEIGEVVAIRDDPDGSGLMTEPYYVQAGRTRMRVEI